MAHLDKNLDEKSGDEFHIAMWDDVRENQRAIIQWIRNLDDFSHMLEWRYQSWDHLFLSKIGIRTWMTPGSSQIGWSDHQSIPRVIRWDDPWTSQPPIKWGARSLAIVFVPPPKKWWYDNVQKNWLPLEEKTAWVVIVVHDGSTNSHPVFLLEKIKHFDRTVVVMVDCKHKPFKLASSSITLQEPI